MVDIYCTVKALYLKKCFVGINKGTALLAVAEQMAT